MSFLDGATKKKWLNDPNSLLKESDFSTAQKSMRTEVQNKTAGLRAKSLPVPGEGDDRNWLEKRLNTPQKTGLLGDILDVISRGQYASANIAKTLTDDNRDSFGDVMGAGYRGLSGQDRTSYRDVLAQSGMEQGPLRSTLGFAGDVLLDPTTYLTLGTGTAAKIGGKTAAKGLGKIIPKALGREAVDRGGLKFMGASIIPKTVIDKGVSKVGLDTLGNALRDSKPGQVLGKALVPNFREAGTDKKVWDKFVDTKKGYQNSLAYAQNKAVEDAIGMAKGFTKAERTAASHAIQYPSLYTGASTKVKGLADAANKSFADSSKIEQELGLLKTSRPNSPLGLNVPKIELPVRPLANYKIKQTIPQLGGKTGKAGTKQVDSIDNYVQRIEEPGIQRATIDKPHGIYTSLASVNSPHKDLGGKSFYWKKNPEAKVLDLIPYKIKSNREIFPIETGSAIYSAAKFLGKDETERLMAMKKNDLTSYLKEKYPDYQWERYADTDQQMMVEGLGGILAKKNGYDAIQTIDKSLPEFSEYVGLTDKAMNKVDKLPDFTQSMASQKTPIKLKPRELTPIVSQLKATPNYVPGIYPEKGKSFLQGIINKDGIRASIGSHAKQKKFETLQDAITAGLKPETDIAKLVGQRQVVSARAVETQKFINETIANHGTKINAKNIDKLDPSMGVYLPKGSLAFFPAGTVPDEFMQLVKGMSKDEMIEIPAGAIKSGVLVSKNVPVYALPKQIAGELNNFKAVQADEGSKGILKIYDTALNLWKGYATAVNPGFHSRNAQSNVFQTTLNGGKALLNPLNHVKAAAVVASETPILKRIAPLVDKYIAKGANTVNINGSKLTLPEVKELMKKEGVLNTGWLNADIPNYIGKQLDEGLREKLTPKFIAQSVNPLSQKNLLIKGGRAVGSGVENQARSFNFLSELKKTGDVKESAKTVDKTLFDYRDVTPFEKNVLKRTIPFYTWMRKNVPLQTENLIRTPGKYAATKKGLDSIRDLSDPVDEKNLPEYMDNPNWVKTPLEQGGNPMYWNSNLPLGDLEKLNPSTIGNTALSSLAPLLKAPLELQFNQNSFFGDKIEKYPGEMKKAPGYMPNLPDSVANFLGAQNGVDKTGVSELQVPAQVRFLMQQVPFMENVSRSLDLKGDNQDNQLLSFLMGAKISPFDEKKAEMNALYEQRDALRAVYDKYQTQGLLPTDEEIEAAKKKKTTKKWLK